MGDIAMCKLYPSLSHLLQEFEDALVKHRQARSEVMSAAKEQLQTAAKSIDTATKADVKWMQGLRYIDEALLDDLYRSLITACTDLRATSTPSHALKLQREAQQGLGEIVAAFQSADFQSRCALAAPEGLVSDMRQAMLPPSN